MIDLQSQSVLQAVVARESRSLLLYVGDAYPWTTAEERLELAELRELIRAEGTAVMDLARYLIKQKAATPQPGSYPARFTSFNFVALSYLLPRLLTAQKHSVAELEADLTKVTEPAAREQVSKLLAVKKQTLAGLESLTTTPQPVSA